MDELTFQNGYRVLYDSDGSTYPSPEWTPTRAVLYIVESDTYFTVRAAFDVEPNTLQAQYEVQGIATIDGATYTFPLQTFSVGGEGNGDAGFFTSLQFLPDSVQTLDNVSTSWVYRKKDTTTWYDAGSSSNNLVFLVLAPPITSNLYRTVMNHACANEGASTPDTVFLDCWSQFAGPADTRTWSNAPLYYYKPGVGFQNNQITSTGGLMANHNGQCGSWVNFFRDVVRSHGIATRKVLVEALGSVNNTGSWDEDQGIVVKDWYNDNEGTSGDPVYVSEVRFNEDYVDMIPDWNSDDYWDLTNNEGYLPGQNSGYDSPSAKVFGLHYIVYYPSFSTDEYFDPSYGVRFDSENDFEGNALWGFFSNVYHYSPTWTYIDVRPTQGHGVHFAYGTLD